MQSLNREQAKQFAMYDIGLTEYEAERAVDEFESNVPSNSLQVNKKDKRASQN